MNSFARALLPGQAANERADKTFDSILVVLNLFPCFPSYFYQIYILPWQLQELSFQGSYILILPLFKTFKMTYCLFWISSTFNHITHMMLHIHSQLYNPMFSYRSETVTPFFLPHSRKHSKTQIRGGTIG